MALRTCRECGVAVSSEAKSCPHCGIKNPGKAALPGATKVLFLIAFGIFGLMIFLPSNDPVNNTAVNSTAAATTPATNNGADTAAADHPDLGKMLADIPKFENPLFTKSGNPFCDTKQDLDALKAVLAAGEAPTFGNSPGCRATKNGERVVIIKSGPFMSGQHYVRILNQDGTQDDGWLETTALRN